MYFFLLFGTGLPTVFIIQCSLTVTFHLTFSVMNHSLTDTAIKNNYETAVALPPSFTDL